MVQDANSQLFRDLKFFLFIHVFRKCLFPTSNTKILVKLLSFTQKTTVAPRMTVTELTNAKKWSLNHMSLPNFLWFFCKKKKERRFYSSINIWFFDRLNNKIHEYWSKQILMYNPIYSQAYESHVAVVTDLSGTHQEVGSGKVCRNHSLKTGGCLARNFSLNTLFLKLQTYV